MRLGVKLDTSNDDPEEIARAYVDAGYSAAICPPVSLDQPEHIRGLRDAFARYDVMLAEIGVWNNMLDPDPARCAANVEANIRALALADEKDIIMRDQLTIHLDEVRPGLDAIGDSISMSFDPVAHDALGLQILTEMIEASDEGFAWADRLANPWLENGAVLGLGTNDPDNMDLVEASVR